MQHPKRLENLIEYATMSASAAKAIAHFARIPFLGVAAALVLSSAKSVEASKRRPEFLEFLMLEDMHEILCFISLYSISIYETDGVLPPALLDDIAEFTGTLQETNACLVKAQPGKWLGIFQISNARMGAKERHEEVLAFLAAHPELANSKPSTSSSVVSLSMHPPVPPELREAEIKTILLGASDNLADPGASGGATKRRKTKKIDVRVAM
ncbi:hypothetical protein FB451DRAFT_1564772 [Mycena latifolia]|nr:hypothetical protein FB451DRAFT_1564772 [Mycena latifolia]